MTGMTEHSPWKHGFNYEKTLLAFVLVPFSAHIVVLLVRECLVRRLTGSWRRYSTLFDHEGLEYEGSARQRKGDFMALHHTLGGVYWGDDKCLRALYRVVNILHS